MPHTVKADPFPNASELSKMGDHSNLATDLRPLYVAFMQDLNLLQPAERYESERLLEAVLEFARSTGVPHPANSHSYQCLILGFSYADVRVFHLQNL